MHRVVTHFLRDRQKPDTVLCQLADIKLHFEVIAEEP